MECGTSRRRARARFMRFTTLITHEATFREVTNVQAIESDDGCDDDAQDAQFACDGAFIVVRSRASLARVASSARAVDTNDHDARYVACAIANVHGIRHTRMERAVAGAKIAMSARDVPVRVVDVASAAVVGAYRSYDHVDEIASALGVGWTADGEKVLCGTRDRVDAFDVRRPGRTAAASARTKTSQRGPASACEGQPMTSSVFACLSYGGFDAIDCAVYDLRDERCALAFASGGSGGTCARWSPCGNYLYVGARRSTKIKCVDVRYTGRCVYELERATGETNQRVMFDVEPCGAHLISGDAEGYLRAYDLSRGVEILAEKVSEQCVNSFAFHPYAAVDDSCVTFGSSLVRGASTSGERVFAYDSDSSSSSSSSEDGDSSEPAFASDLDDDDTSSSTASLARARVRLPSRRSLRLWNWPTRVVECHVG